MTKSDSLLNEALLTSQEELSCLKARDVDGVTRLTDKRMKLMDRAFKIRDGTSDKQFLDKLMELNEFHTILSAEAKNLHASLKNELLRLKSENRRFSGYSRGAHVKNMSNRYISRIG